MPRKSISPSKTIDEQIFEQKVKIWDLYCKSRVAEAVEKTQDSKFRDIYHTYNHSFNLWGGVEFVFWLQALVKKCRTYDSKIENIFIFSMPSRIDSKAKKLLNLKVIAKQMGLDVTITDNAK